MILRAWVLALAGVVMTTGFAAPSRAVEETYGDVPVTRDLTAVIALQGLPCGKVVSAMKQGEDDYLAACENGNRYRVFVDAEGRVVVEKHD